MCLRVSYSLVFYMRMRQGLETKLYWSQDRNHVFCLIRCSVPRLCAEADRVDYACKLDKRMLRALCMKGVVVDGERKCGPIIIDDPGMISSRDPYEHIYGELNT